MTSLRYTTGEPAAEIAMLPEVIADTTCGKDITPFRSQAISAAHAFVIMLASTD